MAPLRRYPLFSDIQFLDQASILLNILFLEVIQQASSFTYELNQRAFRIEIFLVALQVTGQVVDAVREKSDLPFCGSCVAFRASVFLEDLLFYFFA